jgi:hypothetical protein
VITGRPRATISSIYAKPAFSARVGAALFTMQHDLAD